MKSNFTSAPVSSVQGKDTNINRFLKVIPYLTNVSSNNIVVLSQRFSIDQSELALLINLAAKGGVLCYAK